MYYKTGKEEDFSSYARKQLKRARSSTDLEEEEEASSSQPRDHDVPLDDIEENLSYDYEFFNDDAINVPDACMNDSQSIDGTKEENDYYKEINDECDIDLFQIRQRKKIKCLRDLIESEGFHDPISTPVAISQSQLLFMILKLNTCNHLSLTTLSNILSLINSIFEESILPASKYMVDKIFNNDDDVDYHITCPKCNKYLGNLNELISETNCSKCNCGNDKINQSSNNFFAILDPSKAIKNLLEMHENYYYEVMKRNFSDTENIRDIYDGEMYKNFVSQLPPDSKGCYVSVTFNSDGAAPFKSSPLSVRPIFIMLNEIPLQERMSSLIPVALWFNKNKPDMTIFLKIFVQLINRLSDSGIPCIIKGEEIIIKVYCILCCVDTVARAPMQGLTQFNVKYGCNLYLHPTEYYGTTRYPYYENLPALRTANQTIDYMLRLSSEMKTGNSIYGVKKVSALINLQYFDIIRGFVPDYMHCILCGVGKQITEYLIKSDSEFYGNLLDEIKFPYQVGRMTRPLSGRRYWKCKEWENWILYASLVLFSLKYKSPKLQYWSLLVESLHILLQENITTEELNNAEENLRQFVKKKLKMISKSKR
ncbi:hypothetical protein TKK_0005551 [Trichogramma kaykai]